MTPFELLTLAASSWYIAFVVTSTAGPLQIFYHLREWRGGWWHGRRGEPTYARWTDPDGITHETEKIYPSNGLLDCIICLSIWVALILRLIGSNVVTDAFAIAGVALWIHAYSNWVHVKGG